MKRLLAFITLLVLLLCCGCDRLALLPENDDALQPDYVKACDFLKEGELEKAYDIFLTLGDYKDSKTHLSKFTYLPVEVLSEEDGMGETVALYRTTYEYDDKGLLLKSEGSYTNVEGPGFLETREYSADGKLIKSQSQSEAGYSTVTYEYNDKDQLVKRIGCTDGANVGGIITYTYDDNGNLAYQENSSYFGTDVTAYESETPYHTDRTEYTYDSDGNCVKIENVYPESRMTYTIEYSQSALPVSVVSDDGNGYTNRTDFTYDNRGRCEKVEASYETVTFVYDKEELPVSALRVRDGGKPCNVTYKYKLYYVNFPKKKTPFHLEQYLPEN